MMYMYFRFTYMMMGKTAPNLVHDYRYYLLFPNRTVFTSRVNVLYQTVIFFIYLLINLPTADLNVSAITLPTNQFINCV